MVALILAVALPSVRPDPADQGAPAGSSGAPVQAGVPDLANLTPRQAADQLYNRIMSAAEAGDSAGAVFFLPMAQQAYDQARPLDADGLFHLSLLQSMAGDAASALATAEEALAAHPGHLLNLSAAGRAAAQAGDTAAAVGFYRSFLESYDEEMAKGIEEYDLHSGMMPELRREAEALAGG
jgi:tetratricopeptide (TPR) repeat protein